MHFTFSGHVSLVWNLDFQWKFFSTRYFYTSFLPWKKVKGLLQYMSENNCVVICTYAFIIRLIGKTSIRSFNNYKWTIITKLNVISCWFLLPKNVKLLLIGQMIAKTKPNQTFWPLIVAFQLHERKSDFYIASYVIYLHTMPKKAVISVLMWKVLLVNNNPKPFMKQGV